jgi:hypothetical protein
VADDQAGGNFDYLFADTGDDESQEPSGEIDDADREHFGYLLDPEPDANFDAFDESTWPPHFPPSATPQRRAHWRKETAALIASAVALVAIVVSVALLAVRSGGATSAPEPSMSTTSAGTAVATAESTSSPAPPPPPPPPPVTDPAPVVHQPRHFSSGPANPSPGPTLTPVTRSPLSVSPNPPLPGPRATASPAHPTRRGLL